MRAKSWFALLFAALLVVGLAGCKTQSTRSATHTAPYNSMVRYHCLYCDMEYNLPGTCCGPYQRVLVGVPQDEE